MSKDNRDNADIKKPVDVKTVRKQSALCSGGGIIMLAIGIGATAFSYDNAKPGGTYTIYTGIIVMGVWFVLKGLFGLIYPNFFVKRAEKRAVVDSHEIAEEPQDKKDEPIKF